MTNDPAPYNDDGVRALFAEIVRERARMAAEFRAVEMNLAADARRILANARQPPPPPPSEADVADVAEDPRQAAARLVEDVTASVERQMADLLVGTKALVDRAHAHLASAQKTGGEANG